MNTININKTERVDILEKVSSFLKLKQQTLKSLTARDGIKELCVIKLCKVIGLSGNYNYQSEFFNFFSSIMGEAVCERISIKIRVAPDELRLIKYEHINLVQTVMFFLETKSLEEAFLDAFNLADRFKYLIPKLKKV